MGSSIQIEMENYLLEFLFATFLLSSDMIDRGQQPAADKSAKMSWRRNQSSGNPGESENF